MAERFLKDAKSGTGSFLHSSAECASVRNHRAICPLGGYGSPRWSHLWRRPLWATWCHVGHEARRYNWHTAVNHAV